MTISISPKHTVTFIPWLFYFQILVKKQKKLFWSKWYILCEKSITKKFEGDKNWLIFESFGFYGVFFILTGSIFFIIGDIHGAFTSQYAMGYLSFAWGYLFFLVGKYKTFIEQSVLEGEDEAFFDLNSSSSLVGLIGCVGAWLTFSNQDWLGKDWTFYLSLYSNVLWVISGLMLFYTNIYVEQNFLNWEFYEGFINLLASCMMLFNAIGKIQFKQHNVLYFSSIASALFIISGISYVLRQERNISNNGKENLRIIVKVLRHYIESRSN